MYSGEARLQSDTVQNLLSAANLFQLKELRDGCAYFMGKKLDIENCIGIHFFAQVTILICQIPFVNFKDVFLIVHQPLYQV